MSRVILLAILGGIVVLGFCGCSGTDSASHPQALAPAADEIDAALASDLAEDDARMDTAAAAPTIAFWPLKVGNQWNYRFMTFSPDLPALIMSQT